MIDDAIAHYHDLLAGGMAEDTFAALDADLRSRRLTFGDRIICSVLRPYFLSSDEAGLVRRAGAGVLSALHKAFAALDDASYETVLGLTPDEAALARISAGFEPVETLARIDGFLTRETGEFKVIEFNAESPGGIAFGTTLARIFAELPAMRAFRTRYDVHSEPALDHSIDALLGAYAAWGGANEVPSVGIVDWSSAPTYVEFEICRDAFRARGIPAEIVDPSELEIAGGRLRAGEFEIDLVYRRLVASEIPRKLGLDHPIVRAGRDRVACLASGFGALALSSKAMLALVSDPARATELTAEERRLVDAHIPWTRSVVEGSTTDWTGAGVDLVELALANREQLVVKPANEYGGSGVVLGWTVTATEWEAALRTALDRPHVIQQRVALPAEPFPTCSDGRLELVEYLTDIDPYCFSGRTDRGFGTRLSRSQLLNVTAGGGSASPVFTIAKK